MKSLLPDLGLLGVSDGSGELRVQLGAIGGLSRPSPPWDSASFWPCSALGLDSGLGASQELLGERCRHPLSPSHPLSPLLPARPNLQLSGPWARPKVKAAG